MAGSTGISYNTILFAVESEEDIVCHHHTRAAGLSVMMSYDVRIYPTAHKIMLHSPTEVLCKPSYPKPFCDISHIDCNHYHATMSFINIFPNKFKLAPWDKFTIFGSPF